MQRLQQAAEATTLLVINNIMLRKIKIYLILIFHNFNIVYCLACSQSDNMFNVRKSLCSCSRLLKSKITTTKLMLSNDAKFDAPTILSFDS